MRLSDIDRDIFQHELVGVAEEMSMALRRAAFSSIIWDMYDYACGLLLPDGTQIAQAQTIPAQLGIMPMALAEMLRVFPLETWQAGDVYLCNDPYRGCTHTPDLVVFSPCVVAGKVVAIASTVAHHIDVGGRVPGTEAATAAELFEEGIVFPPLRLLTAGTPNQAVFDIFANNVRDPVASLGDLRAQIAGCRIGERRVADLCRRYGSERFAALSAACLDYAERYLAATLEELEGRSATAEILMEDDAASDAPLRLAVTASVTGGRLRLDFAGTSEQRANGLNCPYASTLSMTHYATKAILAPDLPHNGGLNRRIDILVPPRSLLNPQRPAAVSVRHLTQQSVADVVLKALAVLVPDAAAAGCQIAFPTFCAGGLDDRPQQARADGTAPYYVISDIIGGGMGGFSGGDGMNAIDTHGGNCALLSAEVMETMSPFRVWSTSLVPGSAGAGRHRGGLAIRRDYELLGEESVLSGYLQQTRPETAPWGLEGGAPGGASSAGIVPAGGEAQPLRSKFVAVILKRGDRLFLESAGGGGYGPPTARDPESAARDVALGYL